MDYTGNVTISRSSVNMQNRINKIVNQKIWIFVFVYTLTSRSGKLVGREKILDYVKPWCAHDYKYLLILNLFQFLRNKNLLQFY